MMRLSPMIHSCAALGSPPLHTQLFSSTPSTSTCGAQGPQGGNARNSSACVLVFSRLRQHSSRRHCALACTCVTRVSPPWRLRWRPAPAASPPQPRPWARAGAATPTRRTPTTSPARLLAPLADGCAKVFVGLAPRVQHEQRRGAGLRRAGSGRVRHSQQQAGAKGADAPVQGVQVDEGRQAVSQQLGGDAVAVEAAGREARGARSAESATKRAGLPQRPPRLYEHPTARTSDSCWPPNAPGWPAAARRAAGPQ